MADDNQNREVTYLHKEHVVLKWLDRIIVVLFGAFAFWLGFVMRPLMPKHLANQIVPEALQAGPEAEQAAPPAFVTEESLDSSIEGTKSSLKKYIDRRIRSVEKESVTSLPVKPPVTILESDEVTPADTSKSAF